MRVKHRTLYEIASIFSAVVVIVFAVTGMFVSGLGDEGPGSAGFLICALFLLLGLGRLYLGLRRGTEGAEVPRAPAARPPREPSAPRRAPRCRPRR